MVHGFNNNQVGRLPGRPTAFGGSSRPQGMPQDIVSPWGEHATIYCKAGKYYTDPQCTDQLEGKNLKEATESYWNRQTSGTPTSMDTSVSTPQSNSVPTPYVTNTPDSGKQPTVSGPVGTLDAKFFALTPDDYEDFTDDELLRGLTTGSAQPTTTYNIDDLKDPTALSHLEQKIQATADAAFRAANDLLNSLSDEFSRREPIHRAEETVHTDYGDLTMKAFKERGRKLAWVDYKGRSCETAEELRQRIYDNIIMR